MIRTTRRTRYPAAITFALASTAAQAAATLSHGPDLLLHDSFEGVAAGPAKDSDAARFLAQTTFGPTDADITHLRSIGYQNWLTEQFAATPTLQSDYFNWVTNTLHEGTGTDSLREAWFIGALGGPDPKNNAILHKDQLRQRVAFALSEIFVISDQNTFLSQHPAGMAYYYDILAKDAFGNFRQLLQDVTLSPEMGIYLNMVQNPRADLSKNLHPDENYAREINQLFSVGLEMLNNDGSLKLSGAKPIATYTQPVITAFAHVFTGWSYAGSPSNSFTSYYPSEADFSAQMVPFAAYHDNGTNAVNDIASKQLLNYTGAVNGGVLASGGTPLSDLTFALDNIFHHPNVAPFIGKQLIQRLVTSNPSPAYVQRIANVFNDDGSATHVRGNLKAVVQAILLDPEARLGQWQQPDSFGKLREPLLRLTHFWRAMGAKHHCGQNYLSGAITYHYANQPYRYVGYDTAWATDDVVYGSGVGQAPLDSPTVFNFFKPSFLPPGEMATRSLLGPEFQIATDTLVVNSTTSTASKAWAFDLSDACGSDQIGDVAINRAQDAALAGSANGGAADPADKLVDAYNRRFMSGQMSPFMRQTLLNYLNPIGSGDGADWKFQRISRALLLIETSPEYMIQK